MKLRYDEISYPARTISAFNEIFWCNIQRDETANSVSRTINVLLS